MRELLNFVRLLLQLQSPRQKINFVATLALTALAAWLEFKVLTLVGPLVASLGDAAVNVYLAWLLIALACLSTVVRILQIKVGHGYVYSLGHLLSTMTLRNALHADYIELKRSHSSVLLKRFEMINVAINSILTPLLILFSSALLTIAIGLSLLLTNPIFTLIGFGGLVGFYLFAAMFSRKALLRNAIVFNQRQGDRLFLIRETVSGIRELRIGALIDSYQARFQDVDHDLRQSQVRNLVLGTSPRFILEALIFVGLAGAVIWSSQQPAGSGTTLLSLLATFGLGAQRLLPHAQSIYSSFSSIVGHNAMITELSNPLFRQDELSPAPDHQKNMIISDPNGTINFESIGFRYPGAASNIFDAITLEINRGTRVALVGQSGSGKSTFLEILCGLLTPTDGHLRVNGCVIDRETQSSWQRNIAYVPQSPFIITGSVRENVLLGSCQQGEQDDLVRQVLADVGLGEWLSRLSEQLDYNVGENGSKLSGGQRQRLAIARALAGGKTVLVMDEITSNLDAENEAAILNLILSLPRRYTIVCSLHKSQVLDRFDKIVKFGDSGLVLSV